MTTVEYRGWAAYAQRHIGDVRTHQTLSMLSSMVANYLRKSGTEPIQPSRFSPWLDWPEPDASDDPLFAGVYDPDE